MKAADGADVGWLEVKSFPKIPLGLDELAATDKNEGKTLVDGPIFAAVSD